MIEVGETAPAFTLEGVSDGEMGEFGLDDAGDRPVVLSFYVYDFSPVCTDQMCELNDMEFLTFNDEAAVFGVSTDGPYAHREFAASNDLSYPLLSDPFMEVYEDYGLLVEKDGREVPHRGIVVLDADRTIRYRWVAEERFADWQTGPMREANRTVRELTR